MRRTLTTITAAGALALAGCSADAAPSTTAAAGSTAAPASTALAPSTTTSSAPPPSTAAAAPSTTHSTTAPPSTTGELGTGYGIGRIETTATDMSRPTPASGGQPATDRRVLDVVIWYPTSGDPADGIVDDAAVAATGPFPLVIFAHGLGGDPDNLDAVVDDWVGAGLVVAAPRFPLSRSDHPGGPDAADVQNQIGDISFLITELTEVLDPDSPLAGAIDGDRIGVSGHSNGAITTLGAAAHTCCRDDRIDAAIEIAGTPTPFEGGTYDFGLAPPMLVVHGTQDPLVNVANAASTYNSLVGPKGLLTIDGAGHGDYLGSGGPGHAAVVTVTTNFWRAYLAGDAAAAARLASGATSSPDATLRFAADVGSRDSVEQPTADADRQVTAEPTTGLVDGQVVTVAWSGFLPGGTINVVQCSQGGTAGAGACDLTVGHILVANPTGEGRIELPVIAGPVGSGTCAAGVTDCVILVNDSGLPDADATILIPLQFAG